MLVLWRVDPLLDNARNTRVANSMGTVVSTSVDGPLLCNVRVVTAHNSWPSRNMFSAIAVISHNSSG